MPNLKKDYIQASHDHYAIAYEMIVFYHFVEYKDIEAELDDKLLF